MQQSLFNPELKSEMSSGAVLSECGRYRFQLWRIWDSSKPFVLWIMHNPSTADASKDDPTIRRIIAFTKSWGYGGVYVGNLFPYRATNPKDLKVLSDQELKCNPENFSHVLDMYAKCDLRVLAYGRPINGQGLPKDWKGCFHYLKLTKEGFPCHPLYLKSDLLPVRCTSVKKKTPRKIYYWIQKVKKAGFEVDAPKREIKTAMYSRLYEIPEGPRYYVQQLIKAGWNVQMRLL